jgi:malonate transporter and related proteins
MSTTLDAIVPVFLVIVMGYALRRSGLIGDQNWLAADNLCFYVLLPALIIRSLCRADLTGTPLAGFMLTFAGGVAVMSALLLGLWLIFARRSGISGPAFTSLFQGATRWHGFLAIAIVAPVYGDAGVALCSLALGVMVPFIQLVNVAVLLRFGDSSSAAPGLRQMLVRMAGNPLIIATCAGLVLNQTGAPNAVVKMFDIVGSGGLGLALLAAGAGISLERAAQAPALVVLGVVTRLIGMPAIMLAIAWALDLHGMPRAVVVIAGATPTASTAYVMARQMGGDSELMANIMTFQTLLAGATLPLFLYILR